MSKISQYPTITSVQPDDLLVVVDVHDTTMAATGTDKKMQVSQLAIPVIDATAGDIQPDGVRAAGVTGKVADAGHVHPFQPWQFLPESYGAKGDGKIIGDGAITSGTAALACATSTPFTAGDVGKIILVSGAGAAGADLVTTIAAFTDSGHVTLTANAGTTVTANGVIFGTDNTAAIKSARSARLTYAQSAASHTAAVVYQAGAVYCVGGAATVGTGVGTGNAIFLDPPLLGSTPKLTLIDMALGADAGALSHWLQTSPQVAGATIAVLRLDGTNDATYGPAAVFGGPFDGYGGNESGSGLFTNICPVIDGLTILLPYNSTFSGWDFWGYAEAVVRNAGCFTMGTVAAGTPWRQYNNNNISNQYTFGLRMPSAGNNARSEVGSYAAYGMCYGFGPSEHCTFTDVRCILDLIGFGAYSGNGVSMVHAIRGIHAHIEACAQGITGIDGLIKIEIETVDVENLSGALIFDNGNHLQGRIGYRGFGGGYGTAGIYGASTGLGVTVYDLDNSPGPVSAPAAPPASGSPWVNGYWLNAFITIRMSAGSITALSIDAVAQSPGTVTTYSFMLPPGHSYTPTYSGGTLSHTVTLI